MTHTVHSIDNCLLLCLYSCPARVLHFCYVLDFSQNPSVTKDNSEIAAGVPDHIVSFTGHYGGIPLHKDNLREVTELSGVMDGDVFVVIGPRVRRKCLQL